MKISVKVKPNAKQERLEKIDEKNFSVWVKEKPQEGKANQAVIKILSDYFGVAKSEVILLKGQTSRQKIFEVQTTTIIRS
ncbi:MAG: DUF167 domain-containing protein [Nitrospira sp.]|nr:DUF167 domain-containing protein [Nitrospira sp.]